MKATTKLIYLASPYTDPDPKVKEKRFLEAAAAQAWIFTQMKDTFVFSPIAACHPVAMLHKLPTDWHFWAEFDELMVSRCDELWVLCIDGWGLSTGVTAETKIAVKLNKPIQYMTKFDDSYRIEW